MITKKLQKISNTKIWATTINIILVIIGLNILVKFLPLQFDLTANKIHTLSRESKQIVKAGDDIITIKAFISDNLPGQLITIRESLKSILDQYDQIGGGNLKIIWLDPTKNDEAESEAQSLGIQPIQFSSVEKDQFQVTQAYFGLAIFYAGEKEVIPALQEINSLEYQLTSTIKKLHQDQLPKLGFSIGFGERPDLTQIKQALQMNYQLVDIDLNNEQADLEPLDGLIIAGPEQKIESESKQKIDRLIAEGKGVIFLIDRIRIDQTMQPQLVDPDLSDLLAHYGFTLSNQLVLDQSAALANFQIDQRPLVVPYPLWIKTQPENRAVDLPPTSGLNSVVFPWISPLELDKDAVALWRSSSESAVLDQIENISPLQQWQFNDNKKQSVLAGIQTNELSGFYTPDQPKNRTKLAVIGDSDFVADNFVQNYPANRQFFLNLVDYLVSDQDLINIRSKQSFSRPLKEIPDHQKQIIRWVGIGFGPVFSLLISLLIYYQRKKWLNGLKTRLLSA